MANMEQEEVLGQHNAQLDVVLAKMNLDDATLKSVMGTMATMMDRGLSIDPDVASSSSLKMLPSYVCAVPDGSEVGEHLALDLGGTNFRVLKITLDPERRPAMQDSQMYVVPHKLTVGAGDKLFDHIADCLVKFVCSRKLEGKSLPLGFTFSFPCAQSGLTEARLVTWTKGYKASGVEGQDVVKLLREALKRRMREPLRVMAVLNDTVGTLMALAHEDPNCQIGVILGTGTNACYMERADRAPKLGDCLMKMGRDQMIINMEWGAFGDLGELAEQRTEYDVEVDGQSINPGKQTFEKMISGMYLGEVVRTIVLKLTKDGILFGGKECDGMRTKDRFYGHYVSEIVKASLARAEDRNSFFKVRDVLKDFGIEHPTPADCSNVAQVCWLVVTRSAHLCAAGIATLLNRMKKPEITVGIDGSVYRFNQPYFHDLLCNKINALLEIKTRFKLKLSTDGSGRGAALVAAVAARLMASEPNGNANERERAKGGRMCQYL